MSEQQNEPQTNCYTALDFSGLERRANYRIIAYREDILHILDKKEEAAIIYQIISRWQTDHRERLLKEIEQRRKTGQSPFTQEEIEQRMWVYMSYNDFVRETGQALGYNTVIRNLDYLINTKKVIEKRKNHDPRYSDYEYRINKTVTTELLKSLDVFPAFVAKVPKKKTASTQMGTVENKGNNTSSSTQTGIASTQTGIASTQTGIEVYPNGGTSHNYTELTHNYNTEERNVIDIANADVSTTQQQSLPEKKNEEITIPPTQSQEQETEKPTSKSNAPRRSPAGKGKQTGKEKARALLQVSEIAAPQKPDPATHPYNGELFMKLADYYRGTALPESSQPHSKYLKAVGAATSLVQRKAKFEDVDKVFRFLLGLDEVKDERWIEKGFLTDLWSVENNLTNKLLELQRIKSPARNQGVQQATSSMATTHGQRPEDYKASPQAISRRAQLEREWAEEDAAKATKVAVQSQKGA